MQEDFAVDEEIEDNGDGEHDEGNEGQNEQQEEGEDIVHGTEKIRCVAKEKENTKVSKPCVSSKFEGGGVIVIKKSEPKHEMKSCNDKEKGKNNYEKVTEESTQCEAISSKDTGELDKPTQPGKGDGEVKKTEKISQLEDINYTESAQSEANASRSQEILVLEQSKDTEEVINPNEPEEVKEESAQLAFSSKDTEDLVKPTQPVKGKGDVEKMEKIGELEDHNFTESAKSEAKISRSKEMMTIERPKDTAEIEPELPLGGQDDTQPEESDRMAYTAENIAELEVGDNDEQGTVLLQALRKEAGIPDKENIKVNPIDSQKPKQGRHTSRKSKISPQHFFQQNEVSTEVASDGSDPKSEKERRTESADTSVQPAKTDKKKRTEKNDKEYKPDGSVQPAKSDKKRRMEKGVTEKGDPEYKPDISLDPGDVARRRLSERVKNKINMVLQPPSKNKNLEEEKQGDDEDNIPLAHLRDQAKASDESLYSQHKLRPCSVQIPKLRVKTKVERKEIEYTADWFKYIETTHDMRSQEDVGHFDDDDDEENFNVVTDCNICGIRSYSLADHLKHTETHGMYTCDVCFSLFDDTDKYEEHMAERHQLPVTKITGGFAQDLIKGTDQTVEIQALVQVGDTKNEELKTYQIGCLVEDESPPKLSAKIRPTQDQTSMVKPSEGLIREAQLIESYSEEYTKVEYTDLPSLSEESANEGHMEGTTDNESDWFRSPKSVLTHSPAIGSLPISLSEASIKSDTSTESSQGLEVEKAGAYVTDSYTEIGDRVSVTDNSTKGDTKKGKEKDKELLVELSSADIEEDPDKDEKEKEKRDNTEKNDAKNDGIANKVPLMDSSTEGHTKRDKGKDVLKVSSSEIEGATDQDEKKEETGDGIVNRGSEKDTSADEHTKRDIEKEVLKVSVSENERATDQDEKKEEMGDGIVNRGSEEDTSADEHTKRDIEKEVLKVSVSENERATDQDEKKEEKGDNTENNDLKNDEIINRGSVMDNSVERGTKKDNEKSEEVFPEVGSSEVQQDSNKEIVNRGSVMDNSAEGHTKETEVRPKVSSSEIEEDASYDNNSVISSMKESDIFSVSSMYDIDVATCESCSYESSSYKESDHPEHENEMKQRLLKCKKPTSTSAGSETNSPIVRKRRRIVTKTQSSDTGAESSKTTGDSGVECEEKTEGKRKCRRSKPKEPALPRRSKCKMEVPVEIQLAMKSLKKAIARKGKQPNITGRERIVSPDSLKQSSDGKIYTSMTVSGSETIDSDPSPAKPAVFVDEYAAETKEGGR